LNLNPEVHVSSSASQDPKVYCNSRTPSYYNPVSQLGHYNHLTSVVSPKAYSEGVEIKDVTHEVLGEPKAIEGILAQPARSLKSELGSSRETPNGRRVKRHEKQSAG
jgi:hypothetical protein